MVPPIPLLHTSLGRAAARAARRRDAAPPANTCAGSPRRTGEARALARPRQRGRRAVHVASARAGRTRPRNPGQFFMLEPPGRLLPRPMSLCLAPAGELGFLIDPIGPGTRALCAARPGDEIGVLGPLGNGFRARGKAAARRRRDRRRALSVSLRVARRAAGAARLPQRVARGGGGARPERGGGARADVRHRADALRLRRPRLRSRADARGGARARAGCAARVGGADGLRLRRVLRMRGRDRRQVEAAVRRGARAVFADPHACVIG